VHEIHHDNFYKSLILKISMYKDIRGEDLREGFYRDTESPFGIAIYYFTGRYSADQEAIVEEAKGVTTYSQTNTSNFLQGINLNLEKEIDLNLGWLNKKRIQLEQNESREPGDDIPF